MINIEEQAYRQARGKVWVLVGNQVWSMFRIPVLNGLTHINLETTKE